MHLENIEGIMPEGRINNLHNRRYLVRQRKIVRCMSCQKAVMLMLLYTEIQTVAFWSMNTSNAHLSNQISVRV
jgi:hypothetical protein